MDNSRGAKLANGKFEPSDHNEEEADVVVEETPFDEVSTQLSQQFYDCRSDIPEGTRGSDGGSIPLQPHALEIINGVGPGEDIPGIEVSDGATKKKGYTAVKKTEEDSEATEIIDFLQDDPNEMTYGRQIALSLMNKTWYNPQLSETADRSHGDIIIDEGRFRSQDGYPITHSKHETPSLEKAWAYFDHVALPRFIFKPKENNVKKGLITRIINKWNKADKELQRAEPGECELQTRLYSTVFTPHKQLGDFGLGIGLYFSTLRGLTILVLIAGIIHIPNFMYFMGDDYSNGQSDVRTLTRGSAICTNTDWVPCPTCREEDFPGAFGVSFVRDQISNITFAKKNFCDGATLEQGMVNFAALIFIVFGSLLLTQYLQYMEVQFDEDEQTAQDYSIIINNPPADASDPEEWKEYFRVAFDAQVTACTIAVDNDILVRTLVERREKMRMLELAVEPGTKLDIVTLAGIAAAKERERSAIGSLLAGLSPGIPEIFSRMAVLTAKVQGLAQQSYPVTNVFIVFEKEADQRRVLSELSVGQVNIDANRTSSVRNVKYLFRAERVLSVHEPEEPDSIRWEDLNIGFFDRMKQQFFTALATVAALVLVAVVVFLVNDTSPALTAYTIAVANAIFPMFAKFLSYSEDHPSHGSLQTSLYFKIAIFRWTTTAIIITIVTPFTSTLSAEDGLITQIEAQFFAEVTTTSFLQLVDPFGHVQRHFLAPRASTQDAMNLLMQGTKFELAERYTAAAKLLFLTFWYCSIFPGAFFWCAFALQVIYYLDKFSLMRTWKRVPKLGSTISQFNRRYFLPLSIVAMAVFSSYYWSGFPFDNLCESESQRLASNYIGDHSIAVYAKETVGDILASIQGQNVSAPVVERYVNVSALEGATVYNYCLQDYLRTKGRQTFPFIPIFQPEGEEWMTDDQELVTTIYGWAGFGFISSFIAVLIFQEVFSFFNYFNGHYVPTGEDQGENFSELESSNIYIPQVESPVFSYPLLACTVDDIDPDMLDWTDPEHPHAFYDLTKDANALIRGSDISAKHVFSKVAHWPPEKPVLSTESVPSGVADATS